MVKFILAQTRTSLIIINYFSKQRSYRVCGKCGRLKQHLVRVKRGRETWSHVGCATQKEKRKEVREMKWNIITENESCRNRIKMTETWEYPYCCAICGGNEIRYTPCNYERCPLKVGGA